MTPYNDIIFGPIKSRRLGYSVGINLLPHRGKFCSFDCIYCECGWNKDGLEDRVLPTIKEVESATEALLSRLSAENTKVDNITFSGNGEPTLHPQYPEIIDIILKARDKYFPKAKVSSFSNSTRLSNPQIKEALLKIDNAILKLDSTDPELVNLINKPCNNFDLQEVISNLKSFNGNFILQTMFLRGEINGIKFDNTLKKYTDPWIETVIKLHPKEVMLYTIERDTPAEKLEKVSVEEMEKIAEPLIKNNINIQIKG